MSAAPCGGELPPAESRVRVGARSRRRLLTARSPAAFIINPAAGSAARGAWARGVAEMARQCCAAAGLSREAAFTERPGHGRELAADLAGRGFSPVVACGGDGTVNEVASALMHGDTVLGIVPGGSGNGLARELGISLRPEAAVAT
ncbi:MAG: acylglycerol kinase family protein, partial [Acidobacteria bacterium]|nr:acylglycerol kinase family protein [Acidobacteriota bacterium]